MEFVLVFGMALFLFLALIEAGLLLNAKLVLTTAARDGARRAAVEGGATQRVLDAIKQQLSLGRIRVAAVEIEISPRHATYGTSITVKLSYQYPVIMPMMRAVTGPTVPLHAEVVTRSEMVPR